MLRWVPHDLSHLCAAASLADLAAEPRQAEVTARPGPQATPGNLWRRDPTGVRFLGLMQGVILVAMQLVDADRYVVTGRAEQSPLSLPYEFRGIVAAVKDAGGDRVVVSAVSIVGANLSAQAVSTAIQSAVRPPKLATAGDARVVSLTRRAVAAGLLTQGAPFRLELFRPLLLRALLPHCAVSDLSGSLRDVLDRQFPGVGSILPLVRHPGMLPWAAAHAGEEGVQELLGAFPNGDVAGIERARQTLVAARAEKHTAASAHAAAAAALAAAQAAAAHAAAQGAAAARAAADEAAASSRAAAARVVAEKDAAAAAWVRLEREATDAAQRERAWRESAATALARWLGDAGPETARPDCGDAELHTRALGLIDALGLFEGDERGPHADPRAMEIAGLESDPPDELSVASSLATGCTFAPLAGILRDVLPPLMPCLPALHALLREAAAQVPGLGVLAPTLTTREPTARVMHARAVRELARALKEELARAQTWDADARAVLTSPGHPAIAATHAAVTALALRVGAAAPGPPVLRPTAVDHASILRWWGELAALQRVRARAELRALSGDGRIVDVERRARANPGGLAVSDRAELERLLGMARSAPTPGRLPAAELRRLLEIASPLL